MNNIEYSLWEIFVWVNKPELSDKLKQFAWTLFNLLDENNFSQFIENIRSFLTNGDLRICDRGVVEYKIDWIIINLEKLLTWLDEIAKTWYDSKDIDMLKAQIFEIKIQGEMTSENANFDLIRSFIDESIEKYPNEISFYCLQMCLLESDGKCSDIISLFENIFDKFIDDTQLYRLYYFVWIAYMNEKKYRQAHNLLSLSIKSNPNQDETFKLTLIWIWDLYKSDGTYSIWSQLALLELIKYFPDDFHHYISLAENLIFQSKYDVAEDIVNYMLDKIDEIEPKETSDENSDDAIDELILCDLQAHAYMLLWMIAYLKWEIQTCKEIYEELAELTAESNVYYHSYRHIGSQFEQLGKIKEAEEMYVKDIEQVCNYKQLSSLINLPKFYVRQWKFQEAENIYLDLIEMNDDWAFKGQTYYQSDIYNSYTECLYEQWKTDQAEVIIKKWLALYPISNIYLYLSLFTLLFKQSRYQEIIDIFEESINYNEGDKFDNYDDTIEDFYEESLKKLNKSSE